MKVRVSRVKDAFIFFFLYHFLACFFRENEKFVALRLKITFLRE